MPPKSQNIFSLLLFVTTTATLGQIQKTTVYTRHNYDIYSPHKILAIYQKEFIIQVLNSVIIFHQIILAILRDFKKISNIFKFRPFSTLWILEVDDLISIEFQFSFQFLFIF